MFHWAQPLSFSTCLLYPHTNLEAQSSRGSPPLQPCRTEEFNQLMFQDLPIKQWQLAINVRSYFAKWIFPFRIWDSEGWLLGFPGTQPASCFSFSSVCWILFLEDNSTGLYYLLQSLLLRTVGVFSANSLSPFFFSILNACLLHGGPKHLGNMQTVFWKRDGWRLSRCTLVSQWKNSMAPAPAVLWQLLQGRLSDSACSASGL